MSRFSGGSTGAVLSASILMSACADPGILDSTTGDTAEDGGGDDGRGSTGGPSGKSSSGSRGADDGDDGADETSDSGDDSGDDGGEESGLPHGDRPEGVDILFVVDNSWSMGEEQGLWASGLGALTEKLEASRWEVDYRIGFTTTDNGHKGCNSKPGGGGALRLQSCLNREQEFTDPGDTMSRFNTACTAHCQYTDAELEILPTTTDQDGFEKQRPWVERVGGQTNLASDIPMAEALACYGPQGINGCGYEAQLESMYRAIGLSLEKNQPSYDFMRARALLQVVFLTDEADCSYNHKGSGTSAVFDNDNTSFWSNPDIGPTSSICWNAGVECTDTDGEFYEQCSAVNYNPNRERVPDDSEDAVMFPLARYHKFIGAIADLKAEEENIPHGVNVALIAGFDDEGEVIYPTGAGTDFFNQFGIGPGCNGTMEVLEEKNPTDGSTVPSETIDSYAVPPVRLREFAEAYRDRSWPYTFSICESELTSSLKKIGDHIASRFRPYCLPECAADDQPQTPVLDADCGVVERVGRVTRPIPECIRETNTRSAGGYRLDAEGRFAVPEASDVCYVLQGDSGGHTPSPHDDLAESCSEGGYNLSMVVHRRRGVPVRRGASYELTCTPSPNASIDCPNL